MCYMLLYSFDAEIRAKHVKQRNPISLKAN